MNVPLPGSARLVLADNVVHFDPEPALVAAMLEGWRRHQSARFLRETTMVRRLRLISRLVEFTGLYPWQWTPAEGEAFIDHLRNLDPPRALSTARGYEIAINLFLEFLLDPRCGWASVCEERFGEVPQQIFHDGNSIVHRSEYEGDPRRRPLTYDEIQALFDAADARPGKIVGRGREGWTGRCSGRGGAEVGLCLRPSAYRGLEARPGRSTSKSEDGAVREVRQPDGALR